MAARFLVIEDNAANLELMGYLLRAHGYEVEEATCGELGLELAVQQPFDLIICDVQLPGIDGYQLVGTLKSDARLRRVPVVAVSALAMVGDRERLLAAGFDGYLSKPIAPEKFVGTLHQYIPQDRHLTRNLDTAAIPDGGTQPRTETAKAAILIVDDEPANLAVAESILAPSGYEVLLACSGDEAVRMLEDRQPDLILADFHLADETDFAFIRRVQAMTESKSIPFIFSSSTTRRESLVQKSYALGAVNFLFLPLSPQVLLDTVEAQLAKGP